MSFASSSRMTSPRVVIIGGGLAGLSAGCCARHNGFDVTIVEHNLALGGGVPVATTPGRHVVEIMCAATGRTFAPPLRQIG
jgi:monoamine oxidase